MLTVLLFHFLGWTTLTQQKATIVPKRKITSSTDKASDIPFLYWNYHGCRYLYPNVEAKLELTIIQFHDCLV